MQSVGPKYTQGVWHFQERLESVETLTDRRGLPRRRQVRRLVRDRHLCPHCGGLIEHPYRERVRDVRGLPDGRCDVLYRVQMHRYRCTACGKRSYETLPFLSNPKSRITRQLERTIVEMRAWASITDIAEHFDLPWETVKEAEKAALRRRFARVPLAGVRHVGIDEIYVSGKGERAKRFLTVVRDLDTGAVLEVAEGKGKAALAKFARRVRKCRKAVESVCMDMSNSYAPWAEKTFPRARVVYDHFHLIKSLNEKVDAVRRRAARNADERTRKVIKAHRYDVLRSPENLEPDGRKALDEILATFEEVSQAHGLREQVRSIYSTAKTEPEARAAFAQWCAAAEASNVPECRTMGGTVRRHLDGILGYWTFGGANNASAEGFNNKIRWLIRVAYGYRDREYFRLKIFALPKTRLNRTL